MILKLRAQDVRTGASQFLSGSQMSIMLMGKTDLKWRVSVLDCASPLALFQARDTGQKAPEDWRSPRPGGIHMPKK